MKKIIEQGKLIRNDGSHKDLVEYKTNTKKYFFKSLRVWKNRARIRW